MAGDAPMKLTMQSRVEAYLAHRRVLGYRLRIEGQMLLNFARYADESGHRGPPTARLALSWATCLRDADPLYRARRLEVVRVFARHQSQMEPATEIPPAHVLGPAHRRRRPHIYSDSQIRRLLLRARGLRSTLPDTTFATLVGLLACTGVRISEALALRIGDVDLEEGTIMVPQSKRHHSRLIPLHPSALAPLRRYDRRRRQIIPGASHFFASRHGGRIPYSTARTIFRRLSRGLKSNGARSRVRLHDLRHTFACRALMRMRGRCGGATGRLAVLSRYMGHAKPSDTYWYLTAVPELMADAARRFGLWTE